VGDILATVSDDRQTKPDDGEISGRIARIESVPPPEGEEAYGAPTKVGEAAYQLLAQKMAALDSGANPPARPYPKLSEMLVDGGAVGEDANEAPTVPPPSAPIPGTATAPQISHAPPQEFDLDEEPAPSFIPTAQMPVMPVVMPSGIQMPMQMQQMQSASVPPMMAPASPPGVVRRWRGEILIGIFSFLVILIPAVLYLLLFR
jgi:hypothetical protein